ncbi:hypothetical protein QJS04_geneDACA012580 [Acorus gramineus]|uniref:C2 domain-containing protein n=1 Tax=Acorus gramineus TaxID=55184 RepID=A0AAV9B309_ACOGR|nr:hypothetical protein QJS04_geneDACA012580 [Acorus gramineus]
MESPNVILDLKLTSCKGLKAFKLLRDPSVYAVVSVTGTGDHHRTPSVAAAKDDRRRFEWRHTIRLRLRLSDLDRPIEIDLLCEGTLRDRLVGRVRVAVRDLTEEGIVGGAATHVSYQVRTAGGKPNGVLNFSYDLILPPPQMVWQPPTAEAAEKPGWWYRPPPQEVWSTGYDPIGMGGYPTEADLFGYGFR